MSEKIKEIMKKKVYINFKVLIPTIMVLIFLLSVVVNAKEKDNYFIPLKENT